MRWGGALLLLVLAGCAHRPHLALSTKLRLEADTHLFDLGDRRAEPNDWVVRVTSRHGACSGALVSTDVVVTAQHCIARPDQKTLSAGDIWVELGGDYLPWGRVGVAALVSCPCWEQAGARGDVAALVLEAPLDGIPTRPARLHAAPFEVEEVRALGFGDHHGIWTVPDTDWVASQVHRTERAGVTVGVGEGAFTVNLASRPGDSGGPVFSVLTGDVVGVVSHGTEGEAEPDLPGTRAEHPAYTLAARVDLCAGVFARARAIADGAPRARWPEVRCAASK